MTIFDGMRETDAPSPRRDWLALWIRVHPVVDAVMETLAGVAFAWILAELVR